jgi:hypothetical protein
MPLKRIPERRQLLLSLKRPLSPWQLLLLLLLLSVLQRRHQSASGSHWGKLRCMTGAPRLSLQQQQQQ